MSDFFIQEIDDAQQAVDGWYQQSSASLTALHSSLKLQLFNLEQRLTGGFDRVYNNNTKHSSANCDDIFHTHHSGGCSSAIGNVSTPGKLLGGQNSLNDVNSIGTNGISSASGAASAAAATSLAQKITTETLCTPLRPPFGVHGEPSSHQFSLDQHKPSQKMLHNNIPDSHTKKNYDLESTPGLASPPLKNKLSTQSDIDVTMNDAGENVLGMPMSKSEKMFISGGDSDTQSVNQQTQQKHQLGLDVMHDTVNRSSTRCHVLVEFKRQRVVQYDSAYYVAPGEYVVVGGDRGEDVGLVKRTWTDAEEQKSSHTSLSEEMGEVLRLASVLEITQLQGVQTELEKRAVEVAQEKVQEHGLPMRIVDAEYQFDRRKLTFFYQSQHRLDFRNLVRVLYKTFRARIWMEPDTAQ